MNESTEAIKDATLDMRDYALYSTFAVCVGTILLFYTLWLTREMNASARKGVEITQKMMGDQNRAFIAIDAAGKNPITFSIERKHITTDIHFENKGATPAIDIVFRGTLCLKRSGEVIAFSVVHDVHGGMAPNSCAFIPGSVELPSGADISSLGRFEIHLDGQFTYRTFYNTPARTGIAVIQNEDSEYWCYKPYGNTLT